MFWDIHEDQKRRIREELVALREENKQLKAENDRLRAALGDDDSKEYLRVWDDRDRQFVHAEKLKAENERLKAEIERLKNTPRVHDAVQKYLEGT